MIDITAVFAEYTGAFPNIVGKNATGAGATDGTEFIAALIDNWMWGPAQAILNHESITPDGTTEGAGSSQVLDAIQNMMPPGIIVEWNLATDPASYGARFLPLNGQGILRANYATLDANMYVGDANNAAVAAGGGAYYRADDAAGTIPNTTGIYLILPESRGYTTRGLDLAASVDPLGASRYLGDNQNHAMQGHWHNFRVNQPVGGAGGLGGYIEMAAGASNLVTPAVDSNVQNPISDGVNGTPLTSSESRMVNRSTQFVIRY